MKTAICSMVLAVTAALSASAAVNDLRLTFYTKGPDTYKDGTPVKDGEFYALVWVAKDAAFRGFNADGTLVAKEGNELIAAVPFAENGHLAFCAKLIAAADMRRYEGGAFELVMLDTRNADGTVSAAKRVGETGAWELAAVNGYQPIASVTPQAAALSTALNIASPIRIGLTSEIPEGTPQPVITSTELREGPNGREMVIRVKGTAAYLRYTAAAVELGGTAASGEAASGEAANGEAVSSPLQKELSPTSSNGAADPDDEIEIVVPATGSSGLFKVTRK